ncbi:hypothetical protein GGR88_002604 [Sphingomonas jejuensis]|uniref:Uncharacterized protein n=1 Tax=Sphingomonas jejuensis TaxID=904715 RepID=A0ABX0XR06_9SPHN|nr:hypothetical protein [Sphingomonas jejuensis]NJC35090.1 hypothetical protein [Sphingomonas jejuensis]
MKGGSILAQLAAVGIALAAVVASPPARGRMLLVPVTDAAARRLVPLLVEHRGSIVAAGPITGSLVVEGSRADLAAPALRAGIVAVATTRRGCAAETAR